MRGGIWPGGAPQPTDKTSPPRPDRRESAPAGPGLPGASGPGSGEHGPGPPRGARRGRQGGAPTNGRSCTPDRREQTEVCGGGGPGGAPQPTDKPCPPRAATGGGAGADAWTKGATAPPPAPGDANGRPPQRRFISSKHPGARNAEGGCSDQSRRAKRGAVSSSRSWQAVVVERASEASKERPRKPAAISPEPGGQRRQAQRDRPTSAGNGGRRAHGDEGAGRTSPGTMAGGCRSVRSALARVLHAST